jgi:hypothetical protein
MTSRERGLDALGGQNSPRRDAHREDGGLSVFREPEMILGALEAEPGEREFEGLIGLGEGLGGDGKVFRQLAAHADDLRTLTRK